MRKLFARFRRRNLLSYDRANGVEVTTSLAKQSVTVDWSSVEKIVLVSQFEEYSGYFLTDEYKSKELYNDIFVDCNRNIVKIRTGGAATVKKNSSEPFSSKFGTTCIYFALFVVYKSAEGKTNLFATHYKDENKKNLLEDLKSVLDDEKVLVEKRIEGFNYIYKL